MTIVVTGAAGFVGRAVVAELLARGHAVVAVDRRPVTAAPGLAVLHADVADPGLRLTDALAHATGVIHLAGRPGVREGGPGVEAARTRDNVVATSAVLRHTSPETPLVVASSSSVYGGSTGRPSHEDDPLRPLGGYARSKAAAEAACAGRIRAGAPVTVVRPFTVVGAGQRADMAVARWAVAAAAGRPMQVLGGLDRSRDLTDVEQVASALADLVALGWPGTLNLGSGTPHTLGEITTSVARAVGAVGPVVEVRPAAAEDPPATFADVGRLRRVLGRSLTFDLDRSVAAAVASVLAGGPAEVRRPDLVS